MLKFNAKKAVLILSALLVVLVGMIAVLRSGSTQAALTESEEQTLEIEMSALGVTLLENGEDTDTLFSEWSDGSFDPGRLYDDEISVKNSGEYDEYVRVVVKKYWGETESKELKLLPDYICFEPGTGWKENIAERTAEQSVWYCLNYVPVGEESDPLFTGIYISSDVFTNVAKNVDVSTTGNVTTYTYDYDDLTFTVKMEAQAIQYNSAEKAILSAWGVTNVTASGGKVTVSGN